MSVLREYETLYVLNPELADDAVTAVKGKLTDVLAKMGAEMLREDVWGKRKMSFAVKKHTRGNFMMFHYLGKPGTVEELERTMRNLEDVIRFLTTVHGEVSDVEARRAEVDKAVREEAAERAKREAEREQRAAADALAASSRPSRPPPAEERRS